MKVASINSSYYGNVRYNKNNQTDQNISFRSLSSWLIYVATVQGISTLSKNDAYKYIKTLGEHISSYDQKLFIAGITALSKTPDSFYNEGAVKISLLSHFRGSIDYIKDLRWKGLGRIDEIPDSSNVNIQLKKDFLTSFFENGQPISPTFAEQFRGLNDNIYQSFKEAIVETALFSPRYNSKRNSMKEWFNSTNYIIDDIKHENEYCWTFAGLGCNVSHYSDSHKARIGSAYQDLNLLYSLDYTTSSTFLSRKRNLIKKLKDIVDEGIKYGKNKYPGYWSTYEAESFYNDYLEMINRLI